MNDSSNSNEQLSNITEEAAITEEELQQAAPEWYEDWRKRIHEWLTDHTDDAFADLVLLLPDLFVLIVRLAKDRRVPFILKGQLLIAAAYVLSPLDLIPEAALGVIGLTDDVSVAALMLWSVKNLSGLDPLILKENWSGRGDVSEIIEQIHTRIEQYAGQLFQNQQNVWQTIQKRFGGKPAATPENISGGKQD